MNKTVDWSALRADFPILDQKVHGKPLIYFDNAATSQKPRAVIQSLVNYYERDNANVHRGIHELSMRATTAFEAARTRVATFINARSADEIIWTRGTTEAINLVANTWCAKISSRVMSSCLPRPSTTATSSRGNCSRKRPARRSPTSRSPATKVL